MLDIKARNHVETAVEDEVWVRKIKQWFASGLVCGRGEIGHNGKEY